MTFHWSCPQVAQKPWLTIHVALWILQGMGYKNRKQRVESIRYPARQCVKLLCQVLTQQGQFSSNTPKLESKYCLPVPPSKPDRSGLGAFPATNFSLRR